MFWQHYQRNKKQVFPTLISTNILLLPIKESRKITAYNKSPKMFVQSPRNFLSVDFNSIRVKRKMGTRFLNKRLETLSQNINSRSRYLRMVVGGYFRYTEIVGNDGLKRRTVYDFENILCTVGSGYY